MTIIGIDPGVAIMGWGVINGVKGQQPKFIDCGVITTPANIKLEERLETIYDDLTLLLKKYKPQACSLEQLFFNTNAKTALTVGQARGVIILAAQKNRIPLFEYTPLQVKVAITGYGRAHKPQMQEMVKRLLKLNSIPRPDDAADALAIALTHAYSYKSLI